MDNFLPNGAILPGMLTESDTAMMAGFNKSYRNYPLRIGVVTASYPISDDNNRSKLTTEYEVTVIEQNEDKGATTIRYPNCLSAEGFGSIADFFERALRPMQKKTTKGTSINLKGQDGAIVLLLCLDAMSDKGVIITSLTHPDRKTNLTTSDPYLEGEYNGVNIVVNTDGSTSLQFKGATDSQGNSISNPGITELKIETDGSFQIDHSSITFRMDKSGTVSLIAKKDVDVTAQGNINFQVQGNATINAGGKVDVTSGGDASVKSGGKVDVTSAGDTKVTSGGKVDVTSSGMANVTAPQISLNGSSGQVLTTLTDPFVDLITGLPTVGVPTVKAG